MNTNSLSHRTKSQEKCLQTMENEKKNKYLETCLQKFRQLPPFLISVESLIVMEFEATLKHIARHVAIKWKQPYSRTCGYVKSSVAIILVRATH